MKKDYQEPKVEISDIYVEDVILVSKIDENLDITSPNYNEEL